MNEHPDLQRATASSLRDELDSFVLSTKNRLAAVTQLISSVRVSDELTFVEPKPLGNEDRLDSEVSVCPTTTPQNTNSPQGVSEAVDRINAIKLRLANQIKADEDTKDC